jgi:capsid assembly protease
MNAIGYVNSQPWAIQEEWLQVIASIAARENEPIEVVEQRLGQKLDNKRAMTVRDGVAIIPVTGPIFRYANLFTRFSGGSSVQMIALDLGDALSNPNINSIILNVDSPGGEANGINELANQIAAAATQKPVIAYVGGLGASGAYWLASAADRIVIDEAAILGSIGVVMNGMDDKDAYAQKGVKIHTYTSKNAPNKRPKMGTESGDAEIQKTVDALEDVFISAVAKNRAVSEETVISDFGQGGVLVGKAAVDAGMADSIGSFESLLAEMGGGKAKPKRRAMSANSNLPETGVNGGKMKATFYEKVKALFSGKTAEDDNALKAEFDTLLASEGKASSVPDAPRIPAPPAPSASAEDTRLAEVEAKSQKNFDKLVATESKAFADSLVASNKAYPAEHEAVTALYARAAKDDDELPLETGTRVALVEAAFEKRPAHTLTKEQMRGKLQILPSADDEDKGVKADIEAAKQFAAKSNSKKAS